ncbi:Uncharacterised protein [Staphylococcus aureus]|uniref:hypothetical protein n=1 Tax=Staphylococcus aureus TaxID=1280 RepID=UPI000E06A405|nr:hypothetical protein [Staphylococcus aureus]SUJ49344.1 Uncharacterised protein [Staphylococcus aureus]
MEKRIVNYDDANIIKLDMNQVRCNKLVVDDIFKDYEQIKPTIEIEKGNVILKLNGYFVASILETLNLNRVKKLYVDEDYYYTYNELIVKYTEVKE